MTVVFQNPGLIDIRAASIMGLNAKESKNPIGQFGTGLKYAISVLLRNNCQFSIFRGEEEFQFRTEKSQFRGKDFDVVWMDGAGSSKELGYTLELGKHWEPWMAIRELESNVRDEGGRSFANADWQLAPDTTTIVVQGSTADVTYSTLQDIFITTKPLWTLPDMIEVHRLQNPEQGKWLYYRGVRAKPLEKPALFRYNLLVEKQLTEDRTFRYSWDGDSDAVYLGQCDNPEVIRTIIQPPKNSFEENIQYSQYHVSEKFQEEVSAVSSRAQLHAWKAVRLARGFAEFDEIPMDETQELMLERARVFIEKMGEPRIHKFPIHMAADLGPNRLGMALRSAKEIWLTTRVFEMGMKQLISCLFEEYIHLDRGFDDNCYEMQSFLFDTIITMAAKLQKEIL